MNIDYSQWGEQKIVLQFFESIGQKTGTFLDIGAHDGLTGSNTRALSDIGWEGVFVEASPFTFPRLIGNTQTNSKCRCLCAAIGSSSKVVRFYDLGDQLGTTDENNPMIDRLKRREYYVSMITPSEVAASVGGSFDFISIDTEGDDLDIVSSLTPVCGNTKLLCVEDSMPGKGFDPDHYAKLILACHKIGFTQVVGRTMDSGGNPANTLLCKR